MGYSNWGIFLGLLLNMRVALEASGMYQHGLHTLRNGWKIFIPSQPICLYHGIASSINLLPCVSCFTRILTINLHKYIMLLRKTSPSFWKYMGIWVMLAQDYFTSARVDKENVIFGHKCKRIARLHYSFDLLLTFSPHIFRTFNFTN